MHLFVCICCCYSSSLYCELDGLVCITFILYPSHRLRTTLSSTYIDWNLFLTTTTSHSHMHTLYHCRPMFMRQPDPQLLWTFPRTRPPPSPDQIDHLKQLNHVLLKWNSKWQLPDRSWRARLTICSIERGSHPQDQQLIPAGRAIRGTWTPPPSSETRSDGPPPQGA